MDEKKLAHFKEKLTQKKFSLTEMVVRTESYGREKEPAIQDVADMAVESYTREFMFGRSSGDRAVLLMINEALERIKDESFGTCVHCEELIQPKRLEAVPWAQYCLRCQGLQEKGLLKE
jgi:RNA polymerase-binding transcription factor